jgi:hypothetical protein
VLKLILALTAAANLGSPDYRTRERAQATLVGLNNELDCRPAVRAMTLDPDPEVTARAERVLALYDDVWGGMDEVPPLWRFERNLYISLYDAAYEFSYLVRGIVVGPCGEEDPAVHEERSREASMAYVRSLLKAGRTRQDVMKLIDRAAAPVWVMPREVPR